MPAVRVSCLLDEGGQWGRELCRGLVAALLREPRVPGQVEERDRWRTQRARRRQALFLQKFLRVLDGGREELVFQVASTQPDEEILGQGQQPRAPLLSDSPHLSGRRVPAETGEERGARELKLGRDHAAHILAVRPRKAGELLVLRLRPDVQQAGKHLRVVCPNVRLRRELRQSELGGESAKQLGGTSGRVRELVEGRRKRRRLAQEEADALIRQRALVDPAGDQAEIDAPFLERLHQPHEVDVTGLEEPIRLAAVEDAEVDEPPDHRRRGTGPFRELALREAHRYSIPRAKVTFTSRLASRLR